MSGNSDGRSFEQEITADPSKFVKGFEQAKAAAVGGAAAIDAQFKKIGDSIANVNKVMVGFTAVLAGGGALKSFIGDANEWNGTAGKMAAQLGISSQQASVLNVALKRLGLDSDLALGGAQKLSKSIQTNGQAFDVLGVKVRDATGAYRPVTEVMGEVNQKLAEIKNPIEQNIAGQQIYGKGWAEMRGLLKLTSQAMSEADVRARELGLIVGPEGVAMSKQYGAQMRDLGLVAESLQVQFGNVLLPVFTKVGAFMASEGPAVGKVFGVAMQSIGEITSTVFETLSEFVSFIGSGFRAVGQVVTDVFGIEVASGMELFSNALKVVEIAFVGMRVSALVAVEFIKSGVDSLVQHVLRFAETAGRALSGDFAGAKAAWVRGGAIIEETTKEHWAKMGEIAKQGVDKVDAIVMRGPTAAAADEKAPDINKGPKYKFKQPAESGDGNQGRINEWSARLAQDKAALEREGMIEGQYREMSKAAELTYWQDLLKRKDLTETEKASLTRKAAEVEMALVKQSFDVKVKTLEAEAEHWKNNTDERMRIERQIQSMYQQGTAQFEESRKRMVAIERQAAEQQKQIAQQVSDAKRQSALAGIAMEEQAAELDVQLGVTSHAEMLQQQLSFEQRRYEIAGQALQERLQLLATDPDRNPVEVQRVHNEIEALEQQHQLRLGQIRGQVMQEQNATYLGLFNTLGQSWGQLISKFAQGGLSFANLIKGAMRSTGQAVMDMFSQMAAKWLVTQLMQRLLGKTTKVGEVEGNAAVAGSAAIASISAIPIVGPMMAPAAGAAAYAAALSFLPGVLASAAGGYDIPGTINPIVQTHAKEMILPAKYADVIRGMAEAPGSGGGWMPPPLAVHPLPNNFFMVHRDHLVAALTSAKRDGALKL